MWVHTGFWLSGTRSAIVPAIQAAGCLPFSSKCQVKIYASRSGESVAGFPLRDVLLFSSGERLAALQRLAPFAARIKWRNLLGSPSRIGTRRKEGPIGSYRHCPRSRLGRFRTMPFGWPFLTREAQKAGIRLLVSHQERMTWSNLAAKSVVGWE